MCKVDIGPAHAAGDPDAPATIVCGAPNVAAGQTVAVAPPGAVMPDGTKIKRAKLRGVVSEGMICPRPSSDWPGSPSEGILVLDELMLDAEFAPGTPLAEVLPIAGEVLELEITPNRPDCLGVYGVARELHAATGAPLADAPWGEDPGSDGPVRRRARWSCECPELCPRFTARVFEDVTVGPSPPWLKARLMAAGQRPINNVVDITNYAMLLTGQPLHAFDLDRVAGRAPDRAPRGRRRAGARRSTAQTRTLDARDGRDRGRRGPDLDRGRDGRRPLGGAAGDDARAAGGGDLERPEHPPHLVDAGPAQRGLLALREGPRSPSSACTPRRSRRG